MKYLFTISAFIFLTVACSTKTTSSQIVIEDKQKFAMRLADMYFMDSWVSRATTSQKDSIKTKLSSEFEELHGISVKDFHEELAQLKEDPLIFAEIMDSVGVILNNKGKVKN